LDLIQGGGLEIKNGENSLCLNKFGLDGYYLGEWHFERVF
jgi:hypothetical protein